MIIQPICKLKELLFIASDTDYSVLAEEAFHSEDDEIAVTALADAEELMHYLHEGGQHGTSSRPDLIILNLEPGEDSGRLLLDALKRDEAYKRIPVIVFTTLISDAILYELYSHYANCCITKPEDREQYASILRTIKEFWLNVVKLPTD